MIVIALYDKVSQTYRSVTNDINENTAKRNLGFAVNNNPNLLYEAKDLELMKIADFDDYSGIVVPCVPPQMICRASEVISSD